MEALDIRATNDTPKVILDPENNLFEISGRSLPENVVLFYQPVVDWLQAYNGEEKNIEFVFKYIYFNTATSKLIQDILIKLEELSTKGYNVKVLWFYEEDDEDMLDIGEEFKDYVDLDFEIIGY